MKKANKIITLIVIILAIAIAYLVINIVLNNVGKVNQGNYRITDMVVTSSIDVIDNSNQELESISDVTLSLTQKNKIALLMTKSENISKIYIDDIKVKYPEIGENVYISQSGIEGKQKLLEDIQEIVIQPLEKDNQLYIELNIDNEYFKENLNIPQDATELRFDGTILKRYEIDTKNIIFNISFNLNVLEKTGNVNVCKIQLTLPENEIATNGISIQRKNLDKLNFKIK